MTFGPPLRVLAVAGLAAAALIGLVVYEAVARSAGAEVLLRMRGVDPRSVLSGHYVDIALADEAAACPAGVTASPQASPSRPAPTRWIALAKSGARHVVAGAAETREAAARFSPLVVRGAVQCQAWDRLVAGQEAGAEVTLDLGVKRFHASQTEAERIAREVQGASGEAYAVLSIGQDGRARLVGVVVNGRRTDLALF